VIPITADFEKYLDNYIEVIIKKGLNIQPGQRLLITSLFYPGVPIELTSFVRRIVEKAYKSGAKFVDVMWSDDEIELLKFKYGNQETLEEFPFWRPQTAEKFLDNGDAILIIYAVNPDLLKEIEPRKLSVAQQTRFKHLKPLLDKIRKFLSNWVIVSAPVNGWSEKILPDIPTTERIDNFWNIIFDICRVKNENPMAAWEEHIKHLKSRCEYLNKKHYSELKLSAPGTDLTVGLPEGHVWKGGSVKNIKGIEFIPNIPTEEVFTIPHKDKVNGFVSSTKPLLLGGRLAEDFKMTFKEGKVINISAKKGEEFLNDLIKTDDGASRLGEIALVPHSSPISQHNKIFYNMLIDENAANHIALGNAFRANIINGDSMPDEEFSKVGGNLSGIHIDFMVGSEHMSVDGVLKNGDIEPIMENGEWVFKI
jgi:aminopeptidase